MIESNFTQDISALKKLPKTWGVFDFGTVFTDISGGNKKFLKSDFQLEGKVAIVDQGKDLIAGYTNEEDKVVKGQPPYIVFGDHTRIFKFIDFPFVMGADGTKVLKVKDITINNEKFLFHFLNSLNIPNTGYNRHFKYLKSKKIQLPPLPQQQKIANILDAADALRQNNKALIAKYDELTQALFLDMFGDPVSNPKGWKVYNFEDCLEIRNGKNQKKVENCDGIYPIYGSGGVMSYADDYISEENTVIIGRKGNINKPILVKEKYWHVDTAFGLNPHIGKLHFYYLYYFCIRYNFEQHNKTVTIPSLTKATLLKINLPIPPIELQNQFAERVAVIEEQKFIAQKSLLKSKGLFNSLLQKAFKGELV